MKMNEVKNKKVVSALMIGISAMIALQTPITAYASGDEAQPTPPEEPSTSESSAAENHAEPEAVQEANHAVEEANEAIEASVGAQPAEVEANIIQAVEPQPAPVSEAPSETPVETPTEAPAPAPAVDPATLVEVQANSAAAVADTVAAEIQDAITTIANDPAITVTPGANASSAIENLEAAATEVQEDTSFESGAAKMVEAKNDAAEAGQAYKDADEHFETVQSESKTALESIQGASAAAENVSEDVETISKASKDYLETINDTTANKADVDAAYENLNTMVSLIDTITNEDSDSEAIKAACNELGTLVEDDNVKVLAANISLYDFLKEKYENAIKELAAANEKLAESEDAFATKADNALVAAQEAEADVTAAKEKVDTLSEALVKVEVALNEETQANTLADAKKTVDGKWNYSKTTDVTTRRQIMMNVVVNYYIPQILGENIITANEDSSLLPNWNEHKNKSNKTSVVYEGPDNQEYHYTKLTYHYYDEDGNIQKKTRYFNWDGLTKATVDSTGDYWHNLNTGSQDGMVIFEKEQSEIDAGEYLEGVYNQFYQDKDNPLKSEDGRKTESMLLNLKVYTFTDKDNVQQMISGLELNNEDYLSARGITKDANGNYYITGKDNALELTEIVQNGNNLLHKANCLILGGESVNGYEDKISKHTRKRDSSDYAHGNLPTSRILWENITSGKTDLATLEQSVANSYALRDYIDNISAHSSNVAAIANSYSAYYSSTQKAKTAAETAKQEAKELTAAIGELQKHKTGRTALATTVLGTNDIVKYFGLNITDQAEIDRINGLDVNSLIKELDQLRDDANKKYDEAKQKLDDLKNMDLGALKAQIDARFAPPASGGGAGETSVAGGGGGTGETDVAGGGGAATTTPAASVTDPFTSPAITVTAAAPAVTNIVDAAAPTAPAPAVAAPAATDTAINVAAGGAAIDGLNADAANAVQEGAGNNAVEIADEDTARADSPEVIADEGNVENPEEAFTILEEDAAKASTFEVPAPEKKMSWWWIIIVTLLGVTGEEMYRRHLIAAAKRDKDEEDENNTTL